MLVPRVAMVALLVAGVTAFDSIEDIGNDYSVSSNVSESLYDIPDGFLIGAGSSAYQTEGAWNVSDKGESIWDVFLHDNPSYANGDVACDSYHKYETDATLLKNMNVDIYRLSLSWPRLLPDGTTSNYSADGVAFYNNFINTLIDNDITPVITLYHWDLPQTLQDSLDGWAGNSTIQDLFAEYAKFAFEQFGDRVQWWTTFNEPRMFCSMGYQNGAWAPGITDSTQTALYRCAHNVILAHAKAYQAYYEDYSLQGGQVGITMDFTYTVPTNTSSTADQEAAEEAMIYNYAWFADPLIFGEYPAIMVEQVNSSILPTFTDDEQSMLYYSTDFLGVNHYTTQYVSSDSSQGGPSSGGSGITPWGLRGILNWIKDRYDNYPSFVTENGLAGQTSLNDYYRLSYYSGYIRATMRAVNEDLCNVLGYTAWSLLDNLEWTSGYGARYGLHYVDFDDEDRPRTPRKSVNYIKQIMRTRKVSYYEYSDS